MTTPTMTAFAKAHIRAMLRHRIVRCLIAQDIEPIPGIVGSIARHIEPYARPDLDSRGNPRLVFDGPINGVIPIEDVIEGQVAKLR